MFSALKYQGKPLYEYAHKGIEVPRESRKITVFEIELIRLMVMKLKWKYIAQRHLHPNYH